ncbi:MAG TPA: LysM peptidoglycan-binding domain-containing protein [Bacillota bacterium]|nr:LysM peptidoglycan-binding domain-containing protein [Bacillota bacterium]
MKRSRRQRARKHTQLVALKTSVVFIMLILAIGVSGFWGTTRANSSSGNEYHYVIVQDGDTLWKIARETGINEDLRDVIIRIRQLNNLDRSVIHPGQRLLVPNQT